MKPLLRISALAKMGWRAALAAAGALLAGLGAALTVAGMVERRG